MSTLHNPGGEKTMSPEEQRTAIAEACGYSPCPLFDCPAWSKEPTGMIAPFVFSLPDYLTDLNAMHEAEKVLLSSSVINRRCTPFHAYFEALHGLCKMPPDTFDKPLQAEHWAICATAAQRAEAFLKTINLWTK